jgi:N-acetylglucosamine-6-phosphate deacetylase
MKQALIGARVFDGEVFLNDTAVIIDADKIIELAPISQLDNSIKKIDLKGGVIAPGFIDLQVNGGGGAFFTNDTSVKAIQTMVQGHRPTGTTSMMPTLISDTKEVHQAGVQAIYDAVEQGNPGVLGVHIEGPFFSMEKRGAHHERYIREMDENDEAWLEKISGFKTIITLAPEHTKPGQIKALSDAGIVVCAGHTNAHYEEVVRGIDEGLLGFTHLYNAMRPQSGRDPGTVGAALESDNTWCGIIVDNHHVHVGSIRVALAAKPKGKLYLVSDSMSTVGSDVKSFTIYGETISEQDGALVNAEGRLAGSAIGMIDAVRINTLDVGVELGESLRMASLYPAEFMQLDNKLGRIQAGYRADLTHFNDDFVVENTWVAGEHQNH